MGDFDHLPPELRRLAATYMGPLPNDGIDYHKIAASYFAISSALLNALQAMGGAVHSSGTTPTGAVIEPVDFEKTFATALPEDQAAVVSTVRMFIGAAKSVGYKLVPIAEG